MYSKESITWLLELSRETFTWYYIINWPANWTSCSVAGSNVTLIVEKEPSVPSNCNWSLFINYKCCWWDNTSVTTDYSEQNKPLKQTWKWCQTEQWSQTKWQFSLIITYTCLIKEKSCRGIQHQHTETTTSDMDRFPRLDRGLVVWVLLYNRQIALPSWLKCER